MLNASQAFHNAIKQHNPRERALFVFHDPADPHPTVGNTVMVWTSTDINARTPIVITESVNTDRELYIGQAPSATINCEIFNTGGRLNYYLTQENYTKDCTAYFGVQTATGTLFTYNAPDANCAAALHFGGEGIVVTGHDTAPYLRINGQEIPYDTPLPSSLQWPVKAILIDNDAGSGDWGYILALGANSGQYYAIRWEYGETWGDLDNNIDTWGSISSYTWGSLFGTAQMGGTGGSFTFSTSYWMYYNKFPEFAAGNVGYSRAGNTIYEYLRNGNGGFIENKWEYLPVGTFRMNAPSVVDEQSCVFNAYDKMTLFDVDIADFLDSETFPTTLGQLRYDLCEYVGILDGTPVVPNGTMTISEKPDLPGTATGRALLRYIAEAAGCNARMTRDGMLKLLPVSFTPVFDVDPTANPPIAIFETHIASYSVAPITAMSLECPQDDGDPITVTVGTGDNVYRLTSNPLLQGATASVVTPRITPIYNALSALPSYTPLQLRCICDWSVEAGDCVRLYYTRLGDPDQTAYLIPVFTQTIRFSGIAQTTYESRGSEVRPADGYSYGLSAQMLNLDRAQQSARITGIEARRELNYIPCTTAASTAAKTVTVSGAKIVVGSLLAVYFANGNTADTPTLSANGLAALPILSCYTNSNIAPTAITTGMTGLLLNTGSAWVLLNPRVSSFLVGAVNSAAEGRE